MVLQALRAAAGDCEHPHRPHHDPAEDTGPAADTVAGAGSPRAEDGGGVSAGTGTGPGGGEVDGPGGGICRASLADALVAVAGAYLSGKIATAGNPDLYQVIVHVGPEALTDGPDPAPAVPAAAASAGGRFRGNARAAPADYAPARTATPSDRPPDPVASPPSVSAETPAGARPAGAPRGRLGWASRAPAALPPRRRPGHQPGGGPGPGLPRDGVMDAARPRRHLAGCGPAAPPCHRRAAPRRPRTRQQPLPVPGLPVPAHRHPPHHPLGQRRQDQAAGPDLAV